MGINPTIIISTVKCCLTVTQQPRYTYFVLFTAPNAANPGTWNGMVRVVYNPEPGIDRRTLIKGMKGEVNIYLIEIILIIFLIC